MKWTQDKLKQVFDRTSGKCHICHRLVEYSSYGNVKRGDGWEVEHSIPRSHGGSDNLNNLYPAHVNCNRSKGAKSTVSARRKFDKKRAPLSVEKRKKSKLDSGFWSGLGVAVISTALKVNPTVGIVLTAATAIASFLRDPDDYR